MEEKYGENYLGKVVRILSDKELIIDVGDDYLTVGDKVVIYTVGDEILDLDGNSLGVFEHDKATLKVTTTTSSYSICETLKSTRTTSSLFDYSTMFSHEVVDQEDLNINKEDIEPIIIENKNLILKGDLVKKY